jgi:hypothetical protein
MKRLKKLYTTQNYIAVQWFTHTQRGTVIWMTDYEQKNALRNLFGIKGIN